MFNKRTFIILSAALVISLCFNILPVIFLNSKKQVDTSSKIISSEIEKNNVIDGMKLISSIEEKGIYLYLANARGVVLCQNDLLACYDWFSPADNITPTMYSADFNRDGIDELAVLLDTKSDVGTAQMTLHIPDKNGIDAELEPTSVTENFKYKVSVEQSEDKANSTLKFEGKGFIFLNSTDEQNTPLTIKGVVVGDMITYSVNEAKITVNVSVNAVYAENNTVKQVGNISATVICLNGLFSYEDATFIAAEQLNESSKAE